MNIRERIANILSYIYGVGIAIALFVGAFSFFGYVVAIIVGGETAVKICDFIYDTVYPKIIYLSSISILVGMLKMYVAGEKSLVPPKKRK